MDKPKNWGKTKKHYAVYYIGQGSGVYAKDYCKEYLGETWAISPKKACNNVRYRHRTGDMPHGGYSFDILGDRLEEGSVLFTYKAIEID